MSTTQNGALSLYYDVAGRGEPVLWLQGLGADHTAWTVQTAHFCRAFRCILPDNRDVGRSDRAGGEYDVGDLAADALCVLDTAGVEHAHVVGLSLGASIAQRLALVAPDRVRSLVLLSSFARADARLRAVVSQWPELTSNWAGLRFTARRRGGRSRPGSSSSRRTCVRSGATSRPHRIHRSRTPSPARPEPPSLTIHSTSSATLSRPP
ncbi:MAG: alpha/beta hydrolase [Chloroflexia bacterium]